MHTLAHLTAMFDSTDYSKLLLHFSDQKPAEVKREDDQYVRRLSARHFLKCLKIEFISALFHCQDPHQKLNWAFSSLRKQKERKQMKHTDKARRWSFQPYFKIEKLYKVKLSEFFVPDVKKRKTPKNTPGVSEISRSLEWDRN